MLKYIIMTICLLFFASTALAASPMSAVQGAVDQVLSILREPANAEQEGIDTKYERIKQVVDDAFDYEVLSRVTLGRGWRQLDDSQKEQFISLYSELIERTYRNYIVDYSDEDVVYVRETLLTEPGARVHRAEVETRVMARQGPVQVLYRLHEDNGRWLVYDIHGEGISLSQNFRTQFEEILHRSGVEGLLESLRGKVASLRDGVEVAN
ncbi:phospholipid transport system substrate-binding protein [Desulfonatronum zhilinae]|nr:phospholipid transport system substrate-binding protein [Desulfonatronum zhilinae]